MNPSFIYFKEITFHDNIFILDFSSEESVQKVCTKIKICTKS